MRDEGNNGVTIHRKSESPCKFSNFLVNSFPTRKSRVHLKSSSFVSELKQAFDRATASWMVAMVLSSIARLCVRIFSISNSCFIVLKIRSISHRRK